MSFVPGGPIRGISVDADCRLLHRNRGGKAMPFSWYPGIWDRLEVRKGFLCKSRPQLF